MNNGFWNKVFESFFIHLNELIQAFLSSNIDYIAQDNSKGLERALHWLDLLNEHAPFIGECFESLNENLIHEYTEKTQDYRNAQRND